MKKLAMTAAVFTSVLALAACGEDSPPDAGKGAKGAKGGGDALDAATILMKSQDAMDEVKNLQVDSGAKMAVTLGGGEEPGMNMSIDASLKQQVSVDPIAVHQEMTTKMMGMETNSEQYVTEDGKMYMKDDQMDQWMVIADDENMASMMPFKDFDYRQYLDILAKYTDHLSYEEKDDAYVVKIDAVDEVLAGVAKELDIGKQFLGEEGLTEGELDDVSFSNFVMSLSVNKDTFMQEALNVEMEMEGKGEGATFSINVNADSKMSQFNEVGEVKVPQDVIDGAVPFSELEGQGEEDNAA